MYEGDSFFTLTLWQQVGLAALSLGLAVGMVVLARRLRGPVWVRLVAVCLLFWVFVWFSPQVYYAYYQLIIDGLPVQIVVKWPPPGPGRLFGLVSFTGDGTLSAHGQGALVWVMGLAALVRRRT